MPHPGTDQSRFHLPRWNCQSAW